MQLVMFNSKIKILIEISKVGMLKRFKYVVQDIQKLDNVIVYTRNCKNMYGAFIFVIVTNFPLNINRS